MTTVDEAGQIMVHSASLHTQPGAAISNAELAATLQSIALAIRLFGLDALPSVMGNGEGTPCKPI